GIRDKLVTGVQTCALPIYAARSTGVQGRETGADGTRLGETAARDPGVVCRQLLWSERRGAQDSIRSFRRRPSRAWGKSDPQAGRSEERRVGKECRSESETW